MHEVGRYWQIQPLSSNFVSRVDLEQCHAFKVMVTWSSDVKIIRISGCAK